MGSKTSQIVESIRERIEERVLAGVPQWLAPVLPCARCNAGALLIGSITGRLPAEDVAPLVQAIVSEQNTDGSWSLTRGAAGDLSLTLEIVEALGRSDGGNTRGALTKAVAWLEQRRYNVQLREETLILLSSLTDMLPRRMNRLAMPVVRALLLRRARNRLGFAPGSAMMTALSILSRAHSERAGAVPALLAEQLPDGSWAGNARDTIFSLIALHHAGLSATDPAFERGWRFLRSLQVWNDRGLVQNPCDASNFIHAAAARTLHVTGGDGDAAAGSTLTLLHQARLSGGWAVGGSLPTDIFTTSTVLDALSFAGDIPIETLWARRRAVLLLLRSQRPDGGWPAYPAITRGLQSALAYRSGREGNPSLVDVTAAVVQALAYSGVQEHGQETAIRRGLSYLLRREEMGMWPGDMFGSSVFSTARVIEAIMAAGGERAAKALIRGITALIGRQNPDGGWSEIPGASSTVLHTAWVLRALAGAPAVPRDVQKRGREFLERRVDPSELVWSDAAPALPLPLGLGRGRLSDLTTLWALEALAPAGTDPRVRAGEVSLTRRIAHRKS